jgi:hypothetical protein
MTPSGIFFLPVRGFSPLIHFLYCFKSFRPSYHILRSMLPSFQQTQHKHPCPRWEFFFANSWVFPFDPFLFCISRFSSFHVTYGPQPSFYNTTQTSMPPVGFEPTILVSERPQTDVLDRAATAIGEYFTNTTKIKSVLYLSV